MAAMAIVSLLLLGLASTMTADPIAKSLLTCSNMVSSPCDTGKCTGQSAGTTDSWSIPSTAVDSSCNCAGTNGCKEYGYCAYTGKLVIGNYIAYATTTRKPKQCCDLCKKSTGANPWANGYTFTPQCAWWQWRTLDGTKASQNGGYCYLYLTNPNGFYQPSCDGSAPYTTTVGANNKVLGTSCTGGHDDPHFVGHLGAHFDFNGMPGESYCLFSDKTFQVNTKLSGYLDDRTESATKVVNGQAVRTWMREMAFLWTVDGVEHSLRVVARSGPETARGDGYLSLVEVNRVALARMQPGEALSLAGGLTLEFVEVEEALPYAVEVYNVAIRGILEFTIRVRVAHKLLRTVDDAEVHLSFGVDSLLPSAFIHGVLGQTYREGRSDRNEAFQAQLAHSAIAADTASGKGFLDGKTEDYVVADVMSTACKVSVYNGAQILGGAE